MSKARRIAIQIELDLYNIPDEAGVTAIRDLAWSAIGVDAEQVRDIEQIAEVRMTMRSAL